MAGQIIDFMLAGVRDPDTDVPLAGGTIEVFEAGTSNTAYVWDNRAKTLPTTTGRSTITLDAYGRAEVYGDDIYKFVLKDSLGVEVTWSPIDQARYDEGEAVAGQDGVTNWYVVSTDAGLTDHGDSTTEGTIAYGLVTGSAAGGTVYVPNKAAAYLTTESLVVVDRTLLLEAGATISYSDTTDETTTNYPLVRLGDDAQLIGGNLAGAGADYSYLGELGFRTAGDANVSPHTLVEVYGDRFEVSGCTLSEVEAYGIAVRGAAYGVISKNHIYNTTRMSKDTRGRFGISLMAVFLGGSNNERIHIEGNTIDSMSVGITAVGDSLVNGVTVWTNNQHCTIIGNVIENSSEHGIYLSSGSHFTVSGNTVDRASQNGIRADQRFTSITGNTVLWVEGAYTVSDPGGDCTISGNVARVYESAAEQDTARGILLEYDSYGFFFVVDSIVNISGTTYEVTTATNHVYTTENVRIIGTTNFNGLTTITSVPTATTFRFTHTNSTDADETGGSIGWVGDDNDSRFERGITPEMAEFYGGGNVVTGNKILCPDDSIVQNIGIYMLGTSPGQEYFRDSLISGNIIEGFSTGARALYTTGAKFIGNTFRGGTSGSPYTQITARTITDIEKHAGTTYKVTTLAAHGAKITSLVEISGTTNMETKQDFQPTAT
jgi:parallel beta-helix repeat protein